MRQPFWLLNSALLFLFISVVGFMLLSTVSIPEREDIMPIEYVKPITTTSSQVNLTKIYQNDLFNTVIPEAPAEQAPRFTATIPEPPAPHPIFRPEEPKPQFQEPLAITLRGIIVIVHDDTRNRAIIADNNTGQESSYQIGDRIEDAQLIRIMSNKVIFLRSNGQQEVLYLKERDAKVDPAYTFIDDWTTVIKPITATQFAVNVHEFAGRVHSLAQFIDMLDLTGVYQQGTSIGCRVGTITPPSLALSLGLERGDIILSVNGVPATTTANRFAIYQELTTCKTNRTIPVTVIRNGSEITLSYELRETIAKPVARDSQRRTADQITQEQLKRLEERETFAPTIDELRARERRNMLEKGKRPIQNMLSNVE